MVHWTQKVGYDQGVHEDYPMHCYHERYEVGLIAAPINSTKFTDFTLKIKILT